MQRQNMITGLATLGALLGATLGPVAPAAGQARGADAAAPERTDLQTLNDFLFFIRVARYDAAAGLGLELAERLSSAPGQVDGGALVDLIESDPQARADFQPLLARAQRSGDPELGIVSAVLTQAYADGLLARARSADRISEAIELLLGDLRARLVGRERLLAAGEYAMPQLLEALFDERLVLSSEAQRVIIEIGRQAVLPLATALPDLDAERQVRVLRVLGAIGSPNAGPFIAGLRDRTGSDAVRDACDLALQGLPEARGAEPAALYLELAERYYEERLDVTSFPEDPFQLFWDFDPALGLIPVLLRTEAFHEIVAMRLAERALEDQPTDPETIALWVAANFSREIDSPEGYENPEYPTDAPNARFFATAAGAEVTQRVLRRALDDRDSALITRTIAALESTAGSGVLLWRDEAGRQPIVEALSYESRKVRYEAALAIARNLPSESFEGDQGVVRLLASAIRDAGDLYAVVLTGPDREEYTRLRQLLVARGYDVLPPSAGGPAEIESEILERPGIDLVVISTSIDRTRDLIRSVRDEPRLAVAPVVALAGPADKLALEREYLDDRGITAARRDLPTGELLNAIDAAIDAGGGRIDEIEALQFAQRSLAALRDIAISGNSVLRINDASLPLIAALPSATGATQLRIADVLAYVSEDRAQVALAEAALDASGEVRVRMLLALAKSARRNGNRLEDRHIARLIEIASDTSTGGASVPDEQNIDGPPIDAATAAAAAVGSLGITDTGFTTLIDRARPGR